MSDRCGFDLWKIYCRCKMLGVFSLPTFDHVELGVAEDEGKKLREKLESLKLIRE